MALTYYLVDTAGSVHTLDDTTGINVLVGAKGLGMPVFEVNADKLPVNPGSQLRKIATPPTNIQVPLHFSAANSTLLETLLDLFDTWVFPGTEYLTIPLTFKFRVLSGDGTSREIICVCKGGLDDDDSIETGGTYWQDSVLEAYVPDPYWQDIADTVVSISVGSGAPTWFPYYPYNLSANVFGIQTIANTGDLETWPTWTIAGPGINPVLTNLTTGGVISFNHTLAQGETITIDTSPRNKTVVDQNGNNLFYLLSADSDLWQLVTGNNSVEMQMTGINNNSAISMAYRKRYARAKRR